MSFAFRDLDQPPTPPSPPTPTSCDLILSQELGRPLPAKPYVEFTSGHEATVVIVDWDPVENCSVIQTTELRETSVGRWQQTVTYEYKDRKGEIFKTRGPFVSPAQAPTSADLRQIEKTRLHYGPWEEVENELGRDYDVDLAGLRQLQLTAREQGHLAEDEQRKLMLYLGIATSTKQLLKARESVRRTGITSEEAWKRLTGEIPPDPGATPLIGNGDFGMLCDSLFVIRKLGATELAQERAVRLHRFLFPKF